MDARFFFFSLFQQVNELVILSAEDAKDLLLSVRKQILRSARVPRAPLRMTTRAWYLEEKKG